MLDGKVVVVLGGGGRLGSAFARAILVHGASVVVSDARERPGAVVARRLQREFGADRCVAVPADVTRAASLDRLVAQARRRFGRIDAMVNSAYPRNRAYGRDLMDVRYGDFCENVSMHMGGYFLAAQRFARYFLKQGHGNIVSVASIYGMVAPRFDLYAGTRMGMPVEYAAIKSGILHLTRYFARRLRGHRIRVNAISPGGIADGQDRKFVARYRAYCLDKGLLDAGDVAGSLIFLLSDASRYVNGHNLVVDDGFTL